MQRPILPLGFTISLLVFGCDGDSEVATAPADGPAGERRSQPGMDWAEAPFPVPASRRSYPEQIAAAEGSDRKHLRALALTNPSPAWFVRTARRLHSVGESRVSSHFSCSAENWSQDDERRIWSQLERPFGTDHPEAAALLCAFAAGPGARPAPSVWMGLHDEQAELTHVLGSMPLLVAGGVPYWLPDLAMNLNGARRRAKEAVTARVLEVMRDLADTAQHALGVDRARPAEDASKADRATRRPGSARRSRGFSWGCEHDRRLLDWVSQHGRLRPGGWALPDDPLKSCDDWWASRPDLARALPAPVLDSLRHAMRHQAIAGLEGLLDEAVIEVSREQGVSLGGPSGSAGEIGDAQWEVWRTVCTDADLEWDDATGHYRRRE